MVLGRIGRGRTFMNASAKPNGTFRIRRRRRPRLAQGRRASFRTASLGRPRPGRREAASLAAEALARGSLVRASGRVRPLQGFSRRRIRSSGAGPRGFRGRGAALGHLVVHQGEPARQHPAITDGAGELPAPRRVSCVGCDAVGIGPVQPRDEPREPLRPLHPAPRDAAFSHARALWPRVRLAPRAFDQHRAEPLEAADEPADALAKASEMRAGRMAGEAARQPRQPQRAGVERRGARTASVSPARSSRCRKPSTSASPLGRARTSARRSARLRSARRQMAPRDAHRGRPPSRSARRAPARRTRPPRSGSARAGRRRGRSASSRFHGRPRRSAGFRCAPPRARRSPR